jgi:hypothetical protein
LLSVGSAKNKQIFCGSAYDFEVAAG